MCTVIMPFPPSGHLIYSPDQPTWSSRGMTLGGLQAGFLGEKNQKAVPCPLLPVTLLPQPGVMRGDAPNGVSGTLASGERVLDQNSHSPPMQGELPLEDFGMVYKNSAVKGHGVPCRWPWGLGGKGCLPRSGMGLGGGVRGKQSPARPHGSQF